MSRILRLLGRYEPNVYHRMSPLLLAYRIRHRLTGPQRGCSCSRCFDHPSRRVPVREVYESRRRVAELERQVRDLEKRVESHFHLVNANGRVYTTLKPS